MSGTSRLLFLISAPICQLNLVFCRLDLLFLRTNRRFSGPSMRFFDPYGAKATIPRLRSVPAPHFLSLCPHLNQTNNER
jgi:hypothetical protein